MSRSYTVYVLYGVRHVRCMFSECTCQGCQVTQCCILELNELNLKTNDYEACMSMVFVFWKQL